MTQHPYYEEVRYALELFNSKGLVPIGFDDGDGVLQTTEDIDTIVKGVLSVDESWVECMYDNRIFINFFFVLGNEPGVVINDYTYCKELDTFIEGIVEEHYNHFNP